jgi:hypothetical protein
MRRIHPNHADCVEVPIEHQGPATTAATQPRDYVGSPRANILQVCVDADALEPVRDECRDCRLAGATGHEIGVDGVDPHKISQQVFERVHEVGSLRERIGAQTL